MSAPCIIDPAEVEFKAVRAQGPGGQNVNKLSSAVQLRFDVPASSLAPDVKHRLLALRDRRITDEGVVVLKSQSHRSQEANRADAMRRLQQLVDSVSSPPRPRRPTRPSHGSRLRRLKAKAERAQVKAGRARVDGLPH